MRDVVTLSKKREERQAATIYVPALHQRKGKEKVRYFFFAECLMGGEKGKEAGHCATHAKRRRKEEKSTPRPSEISKEKARRRIFL